MTSADDILLWLDQSSDELLGYLRSNQSVVVSGALGNSVDFTHNSLESSAGIVHEYDGWRDWLTGTLPGYFRADFCERHVSFWDFIERVGVDKQLPAMVALWPRGSGKSTTAEASVVRIGAKRARQYVWYISETQDQADKHVATISSMLESEMVRRQHPYLSERLLNKYGHSEGWARQMLRCASGLTVEAIGLDKAVRGGKIDWARPDFYVLDDIDGRHDGPAVIERKIATLTESLLPAGSTDAVVIFVQNLIHAESIASRLCGQASVPADFLLDRIVLGPYPAVENLETVSTDNGIKIVSGTATWSGQSIEVCNRQINLWGLRAFLREAQHDIDAPPGGIWDHVVFKHIAPADVPELVRGSVWIDPAVTSTDDSDCHAIIADGLGVDEKLYRFYSWERRTTPDDSLRRAIIKCIEYGFDTVGVETDQGGDLWQGAYNRIWDDLIESEDYPHITEETTKPKFKEEKAGAGHGSKVARNSRMLVDYENGKVIHVDGSTNQLEKALRRFPKTKPFDLVDVAYWGWNDLMKPKKSTMA